MTTKAPLVKRVVVAIELVDKLRKSAACFSHEQETKVEAANFIEKMLIDKKNDRHTMDKLYEQIKGLNEMIDELKKK